MKKIILFLLLFIPSIASAQTKITELTDLSAPDTADLTICVDDVSGTPTTKKCTLGNFLREPNLPSTITRDSEWDTIGEIETATSVNVIVSTEIDTIGEFETLIGSVNVLLETEIDASSELRALMDDENGTGALLFDGATSPTFVTPALGTIASGVGTALTALNGENIQDDTIDDDSLDFGTGADQISASDMPNEDLGDISISAGAYSVDANSIALTTDTTGNYVLDVADGTGIDGTAAGEGATYTPSLDLTEISSATLGAGSFTTLTFDAGATDPVLTAGSSRLALSTGNFAIGTTIPATSLHVGTGTAEIAGANDVYLSVDLEVDGVIYDAQGIQGRCVQYGADGMHVPAAAACGTGSSSITGADTRVLFFDGADSPAGDAGMTYNKTTDVLTVAGNVIVNGQNVCQESGTNCPSTSAAGGWTDDGTTVRLGTITDNVGIGTTTTPAKLTLGAGASMNLVDGANDFLVKGDVEVDGNIYSGTGTVTNFGPSDTGNMYVQNELEVDGFIYTPHLTVATGIDVPAASIDATDLGVDSVSASELNATGVEAELEGVLDLNELQNQIGDAQIADGAVDGGTGGEIADASITTADLGTDSVDADELNATGVESELESALDIGGEVTSTGMASTVIADSITVTGWALGTSSATVFNTTGNVGIGTTDVTSALLKIGAGGTQTYTAANDVYIRNDLEIDGGIYVSTVIGDADGICADNEILKMNGTTVNCESDATGGGSSGFYWFIHPQQAKLPTTNPMAIDAGNATWRGLFDASTDESAVWSTTLYPYSGGGFGIRFLYSMVSATSGNAAIDVKGACINATSSIDVDTLIYGSGDNIVDAVPSTAGFMDLIVDTTIYTDASGCDEGDMLYIRINRDADGNDTASGDLEAREILIYEP